MNKFWVVCWSCVLILTFVNGAWASSSELANNREKTDSAWEVSLQDWEIDGNYEYFYYYSGYALASKVVFPQDQSMTLLTVKYTLSDERYFVRMQYGQTGNAIKGRGSDSDWSSDSSHELTDYGELDAYGDQSLISLDMGRVLSQTSKQQTSAFLGFVRQKTANELKNIIYYLIDGVAYNDGQAQADNGYTFDSTFQGLRLGVERTQRFAKLTYTGSLAITGLETKADAHWPDFDYTDSGYTLGVMADLELDYALTRSVSLQLGYCYYDAKNYKDLFMCDETVDESGSLSYTTQLVGLHYRQQGVRLGVKVKF